ncbi:MAG TPA: MFS transporter [Candidatus Gallimonas intestinigallinarum]|uniref:MFS transporter n=1 Tax=Candidatus Gallimonas intestinigallinarum TaxID=2838604 RepID=A0A9D2IUS8_9FIRM|nr:MFS transporter [Candidatus Gallimonas intestinigallinarum]
MRKMTKERKLEWYWILYDVGNSAFTLLISTIMPIYFSGLAESGGVDATTATAYWGYAASIVTLCVAVLGPILGTLSDFNGYKRPIFFFFAIAGVIGCAALGIPMPWLVFLIVFIITKIFYSASLVFYDSMLVDVTTPARADDISSKGYAFGYIGSCIPFLISIAIVLLSDLSYSVSIPIALVINAAWWLAFTIPLVKSYRQTHFVPRTKHAVRDNFKRLFSVFSKKSDVPNKKGIILFLIAFFLYIDGVYTIIDMATSFGTALGFDTTNLLLALLLTQVIAFHAAIVFGKLAGKVRNDVLILICIVAYTGVGLFAVFMTEVWQFWMLAVAVGLFQGGVQALSRSYFAKIIPADQSGCLFGILDIFGKGAAFIGTLVVGAVTQATGSVNMGAIPIVCLFGLGIAVFLIAARINRPYLAKKAKEEQEASDLPDTPDLPDAEAQQS